MHSGRSGVIASLGHETGALTLAAVFPQFMTKGSTSVAILIILFNLCHVVYMIIYHVYCLGVDELDYRQDIIE